MSGRAYTTVVAITVSGSGSINGATTIAVPNTLLAKLFIVGSPLLELLEVVS